MIDKNNHHKKAVDAYHKGNPEYRHSKVGKDLSAPEKGNSMAEGVVAQQGKENKGAESGRRGPESDGPSGRFYGRKTRWRYVPWWQSHRGAHRATEMTPKALTRS